MKMLLAGGNVCIKAAKYAVHSDMLTRNRNMIYFRRAHLVFRIRDLRRLSILLRVAS